MEREELIRAMTTNVLESVAPDEATLASDYSPATRRDGEAANGPRGFGAEAGIALILPFLYRYFEKVVDRIAQKSGDTVYELIKRWLQKPEVIVDPALLAMIEADLRSAGLTNEQATDAAPVVLKTIRIHRNKLLSIT